METVQQIAKLKALVSKTYEGLGTRIIPARGKILIRVIPKETERQINVGGGKTLSLVLPEKNQNKPTWEGQVLAVYKPWLEQVQISCQTCNQQGTRDIMHRPSVAVGDHVLFPHHLGAPVPSMCYYWKTGDYRLIDEHDIQGVLEYSGLTTKETLKNLYSAVEDQELFVDALLEKADVIFYTKAVTTSGV